jgi:pimeloyl-ACP methyl ester carboxylesterase
MSERACEIQARWFAQPAILPGPKEQMMHSRSSARKVALSGFRVLSLVISLLMMVDLHGLAFSAPARFQGDPPPIPGPGSRTFPETGQTVTGVFLNYWDTHGGLAQQGFPISPVLNEVSPLDGKTYTVQYFERAVFEYHPEEQPPYNVLLSQLGTFEYRQKYAQGAGSASHSDQQPNNSPISQLFTETGKHVGGKFLDYWQRNGGLAQQGYPISEEFQEKSDLDGKTYTVQYFERAVFEKHPENTPPYDVLLSQLGTFRYKGQYGSGQAGGPIEGLFDVGGYKLWLSCAGHGVPTVIMDSGLGSSSGDWMGIHPHVAESTRACRYDRAGLGQSEKGPKPRTSKQMVEELHALLAAARVEGPYVLVGQAEGGLNLQLFAKLYKSEVAAIVLVDAVHPDLDARYAAILTPEQEQQRHDLINLNREGVTYEDTHLSGAQVREAGPLPNVPLAVLRHGLPLRQPPGWPVEEIERIWRQMQEELAASVPGSKRARQQAYRSRPERHHPHPDKRA